MNKEVINIDDVLKKHKINFIYNQKEEVKAAIKEIVEATIDLCAEKAYDEYGREYMVDQNSIKNVKTLIDYGN